MNLINVLLVSKKVKLPAPLLRTKTFYKLIKKKLDK
jgi:hypothetical protein